MTHYGIVGGGKHAASIIEDGIKDIFTQDLDHTLYLNCRKGASESEKIAYSYVLDNEIPFIAVTSDSSAPKVLVETADYIVDGGSSAEQAIIKELAANNGTLLVMWDDERSEEMMYLVVTAIDLGVTVLELSNGLVPILLEDPVEQEPTITETPAPKAEVELEPLTRDELSDMSIGLLKKAAFAQGIADAGGMSKEALMNALMESDECELPVVASDNHEVQEPQAMVVYMENGQYMTVQVPLKEIKKLLS